LPDRWIVQTIESPRVGTPIVIDRIVRPAHEKRVQF
jgi:hypothetical protein